MNCQEIQDEFICRVLSLTNRKSVRVSNGSTVDDDIKDVTDTFRWLRNNSPRLDENIKHEVLKSGLLETCLWFCKFYFANEPLSRSILLQFLANFSVNHEIVQRYIIEGFRDVLRHFILSYDDSKLLNNSIMLLYNLCLHNANFRLDVLKDVNIIQKIMENWTKYEIEYRQANSNMIEIIEYDLEKKSKNYVFSNSKDFAFTYTNFPSSSKNELMNLLSTWLDNFEDDVSLEVIIVIKDNFFIDSAIENITSQVVNILAKASNMNKFNSEIRKDTSLLKKLMDLLINIHMLGKNSDGLNNEFSRVNDLSALFGNSDILTHHRFWFKSDIIRLIANMCYNHQEHQNLMRTNNIIPILLDCCSFDAKNPLMREWSLFALRNILEGNLDNQNFVANIDSVGTIDPESSVMLTDTVGMATINNSISDHDIMYI